jgi:hypothetical protein
MRMRTIQTAVCGVVAAVFLTVAAVPTSAAEELTPVPLPVPAEEVPVDEGARPVVSEPDLSPAADLCDPGYSYRVWSNPSNDMRVFDRLGVTNNTNATISATFRADTGGTVSHSASISLTAEAKAAIFAKVGVTVNAGIERSMTASTGVSTTSSVKPHSTLKGDYGVWREKVLMRRVYVYRNCTTGSPTYFYYYAPYRKGWRLYY